VYCRVIAWNLHLPTEVRVDSRTCRIIDNEDGFSCGVLSCLHAFPSAHQIIINEAGNHHHGADFKVKAIHYMFKCLVASRGDLLVHCLCRRPFLWMFPKGHHDDEEKPSAAVRLQLRYCKGTVAVFYKYTDGHC
jgi:hypothetical protein